MNELLQAIILFIKDKGWLKVSKAHVMNISVEDSAILLGILDNILKIFTLPNALSMWTLNEAILLISISFVLSNCSSFFLGGMLSVIPFVSNKSAILKPLSAITASPTYSLSNSTDCIKSSLSDIDPPYNGEIKEKEPEGVIPAKALAVL